MWTTKVLIRMINKHTVRWLKNETMTFNFLKMAVLAHTVTKQALHQTVCTSCVSASVQRGGAEIRSQHVSLQFSRLITDCGPLSQLSPTH